MTGFGNCLYRIFIASLLFSLSAVSNAGELQACFKNPSSCYLGTVPEKATSRLASPMFSEGNLKLCYQAVNLNQNHASWNFDGGTHGRAVEQAKARGLTPELCEAFRSMALDTQSQPQLTPQPQVRVAQQALPQPQFPQSQQKIPQLALSVTSNDPKEAIEEIDLKIMLYAKIANNLPQTEAGYRVQQEVLDKKIEELKKLRESLAASYLSKYNTPIYPVNINLGTTAFRYSEIFPSIPYYIPGTKEVGEFLVQPVVSNKGQLNYEFTFLDPSAKYNKEREQIVVVNTDMGSLIDGLDKVREWTETAEKQNVRRRFEKVASCFPKADCGVRQVGKASTEVVFQIYENGSTSGKLQRVKGEFVSGYNMSVESTVLLGAYLKYMRDIGEQEFKVGSMTEKDLDSLFK